MLSKTWAASAAVLSLALLGGCGNEDANSGLVRMVNATTEYATMDLYDVDSGGSSSLLISGTASNAASGYEALTKGTYSFNIVGAGGSAPASTVAATSITKQDHFAVISYLTGGTLQSVIVPEEEPAPSSGNAKLRILNGASSEAGSVDIYVTSHACTALGDTDTAFASSVSGLQTAYSQLITPASGTQWNICATGAGDKSDLRLAMANVPFTNQEVATLILTRTPSGVLLNGMLLTQQGSLTAYPNTLARVRLVADAAAAGTVTATINGTPLGADTVSPAIGNYVPIASGALTVSLLINDVAVTTTPLTAAAGADYTLLVAGTQGAATVALLPDSNLPSTSTANPVKMRLVNGLNNFGAPVSLNAAGTLVATGTTFGTASTYTTMPANTSGTAVLTVTGAGTTVFTLGAQTLLSGGVYTMFLVGDMGQDTGAQASTLSQDRVATPVSTPASGASS
jgi:hypothetical protein